MDPILHSLVPFQEFKTTPLSSQPLSCLFTPLPHSLHSHIIHVNHLCKEEQHCHHVSEGERGSLMKRTSHPSPTISNPLISLVEWLMEQTHPSHSHSSISVILKKLRSQESRFHSLSPFSCFTSLYQPSSSLRDTPLQSYSCSYQTPSLSWTGCIDWSGMVCCCGMDGMGCL